MHHVKMVLLVKASIQNGPVNRSVMEVITMSKKKRT